jgi:hypothetical protein
MYTQKGQKTRLKSHKVKYNIGLKDHTKYEAKTPTIEVPLSEI